MKIDLHNLDNAIGMLDIPDNSIDVILTDPPYLYLKNQKLDRPFDETLFFGEVKRVVKKDGFIVIFGRGTSFYRWNTILAGLGFLFKEEIIWNKRRVSSPMTQISRIHETVSISSICGCLNFTKVDYMDVNGFNLDIIAETISRLTYLFGNKKQVEIIKQKLEAKQKGENYFSEKAKERKHGLSVSSPIKNAPVEIPLIDNLLYGMREKSIIDEGRDAHMTSIHPTQKPVRLLERLLALVSKEGDLVLDPFAGSGSTALACINTNRNFIGFEIDKEYCDAAKNRIDKALNQPKQQKIDFFNQSIS